MLDATMDCACHQMSHVYKRCDFHVYKRHDFHVHKRHGALCMVHGTALKLSRMDRYGRILQQKGAFVSRRGRACSCRGCQSKSQKLPCDSKATEPVDPSEPVPFKQNDMSFLSPLEK